MGYHPGGMPIEHLALALGSSLTAGLNLYLTVLSLGVMDRMGWLELPAGLAGLADPWVLGLAGVLLLAELGADKIPYLDNSWDAVHSFIRIPAGAILAAGALGGIIPGSLWWMAALAGGSLSLAAHGAKSSTRLALNATPEPFTNWFVSLVEDAFSLLLLGLISISPALAIGLVLAALIAFLILIGLFFRFLLLLFRKGPAPDGESGETTR